MNNSDFIGIGWDFPPSFNPYTTNVEMITREENINTSIQIILTTEVKERIMHSRFGCALEDKVFAHINSTEIEDTINRIKTALLLYEPRIKVKKVDISIAQLTLEGRLDILVEYVIKANNSRMNIVFPYYLAEGTDIKIQ